MENADQHMTKRAPAKQASYTNPPPAPELGKPSNLTASLPRLCHPNPSRNSNYVYSVRHKQLVLHLLVDFNLLLDGSSKGTWTEKVWRNETARVYIWPQASSRYLLCTGILSTLKKLHLPPQRLTGRVVNIFWSMKVKITVSMLFYLYCPHLKIKPASDTLF